MADIAVLPRKNFRAGAGVFVWVGIGLALLAASAAALYFSARNDQLTAYASSPTCATFADAMAGKACRYTATAKITQVIGDPGFVEVYFDVPGEYSPFFRATLPVRETPLRDGDEVQVEFWQSRVTRLGGAITADNPASDPRPGTLLGIGVLLLPLGLGATGWALVLARRQIRGAQGRAATGPDMSPIATSDALWR